MKNKLLAVLSCLLLFAKCLPVQAANLPDLSYSNKYITQEQGGGAYSYVVPYTANYQLTLSGAQGASYSSNAGGYGYTLVKTVRLQKGDKIDVTLFDRPVYTKDGSVLKVPSAHASELHINGDLVASAGSGCATISNQIAPNGVTSVQIQNGNAGSWVTSSNVHWHSGNGKSGATHTNQFPTVYANSLVGGCYTWSGHTHNAIIQCDLREADDECDCEQGMTSEGWSHCIHHVHHCAECGKRTDNGDCDRWHYYCGAPNNTQTIGCGMLQGQIFIRSAGVGGCYGDGWSASLSNTGNGKFELKLCEQQSVYYDNVNVKSPSYLDAGVNLVICEDTVCYFKRR